MVSMKRIISKLGLLLFLLVGLYGCSTTELTYEVRFFFNEEVISSQTVIEGEDATAPAAPVLEGFEFIEWSEDFTNVQSDLDLYAVFEELTVTYTVRFRDHNGFILSTQTVYIGQDAELPESPTREGYEFTGWDKAYTDITSDLDIYAQYTMLLNEYQVRFFNYDGDVISTQTIVENLAAVAPDAPHVEGYRFIGWNKGYVSIKEDLDIHPIYELIVSGERVSYTSYLSDFNYTTMTSQASLVDQINFTQDFSSKISSIFYGGFRNADQVHLYDLTNLRSRNAYGYEVAVDEAGIVIEKATLVELPQYGFILSGHSSTADLLRDTVQIGDVILYDQNDESVSIYRSSLVSSVIGLSVKIDTLKDKINKALNEDILALGYEDIEAKMNEAIEYYNDLAVSYSKSMLDAAEKLLLDIEFMLVEGRAVSVKAFWHYPLRAGDYKERSLTEVQVFLDDLVEIGFNRVYVNTNFGGYSVYQSDFLSQRLANTYTYSGYKDYLEAFIGEAHKRSIEVYAWTNTLIAGDGTFPTAYDQKGWLQKSYHGNSSFNGMYFYDIANPEVQTHLHNVFYELASEYALDGIEYDFIRFPGGNLHNFSNTITDPSAINDSGYTEHFTSAFMEEYNLTGDFKTLILNNPTVRTNWLNFKRATLTDTVESLSTMMKEARPGIQISAAVMPSISTARNTYLQDWSTWITNDWVDELDPMLYSGSNAYLISTLASMLNFVDGRASVVVGIFPEGDGGAVSINAEQIQIIQEANVYGWNKFSSRAIFNHATLAENMKAAKREYTVLPTANNHEVLLAYVSDLYDKVENFYQYKDTTYDYTSLIALLDILYEDLIDECSIVHIEALESIELKLQEITNVKISQNLIKQFNLIHSLIQG